MSDPIPKRRWFRFALGSLVVTAVTAVAIWKVPLVGSLTWRDIWAIRNVIATDPRTQGKPILEIDEGADRVAEVVIGENHDRSNAAGQIVFLQKRNGVWKIVTFTKWRIGSGTGPPNDLSQDPASHNPATTPIDSHR